jgi:hypothetical protein
MGTECQQSSLNTHTECQWLFPLYGELDEYCRNSQKLAMMLKTGEESILYELGN